MPGLLPDVDPDGLLEYSVVFSDRALNHMSRAFQGVMNDISRTLKHVYRGKSAIVVPGSGTFGMEAVARQFGTGRKCLVIRNGWFSYRWSQIFEMGGIPSETVVLKARRSESGSTAPYAPAPIEEVVITIREQRPALVCAPHVETASGIILPDAYLRAVADAVHASGGLFVLDCIASGALWVDMIACGVDVLISAPQKGWSSSACCALVMLSERARAAIDATTSTSFACDLKKWLQIMVQLAPRENPYLSGPEGYGGSKPFSEQTAEAVDEEVRRIIGDSHDEAKRLLTRHRKALDALAEALLARETLNEEEILAVTGLPAAPALDASILKPTPEIVGQDDTPR